MALTRTDRDRRILGDRVLAREEEFQTIDVAVGRAHNLFGVAHSALADTTNARLQEEGEDEQARRARDELAAVALQQYSWAYHALPDRLGSSWTAEVDDTTLLLARERLFPLGAPSMVSISHQRTLDGLIHLADALSDESEASYPAEFLTALAGTRDQLQQAIAKVTTESAETEATTAEHFAAREAWDTRWQALREITAGFLRLAGQLDRHPGLFRPLARPGGGSALDAEPVPDPTAPAAPTSTPGAGAPPATMPAPAGPQDA